MFAPIYTGFILSFYCLVATKKVASSKQLGGSSKYSIKDGEIITKKRTSEKKSNEKEKKEKKDDKKKVYKLNKSMVKKKIFAFYHLENKQKYFRLWTLTFPINTEDKVCYKIHNIFLTRLREELGLKDYIWVAERQQNGTLHFHFIFSQFLDITKANYYAKKAVNNAIKRDEIDTGGIFYENYNGLDVSKKVGNFNTVCKYLTKYVTKNNTESERLPYYCSTKISRLFTTKIFNNEEIEELINIGMLQVKEKIIYENEYFDVFAIDKINIEIIFGNMFIANNLIYKLE